MALTLVTETFHPEINGVARTLSRWVETFRQRGHDVQVIRPRQPGEVSAPDLVAGLPLPCYREVRLGLATPGRLSRFLTRFGPDLVHVATEGPLGFSALLAAPRLGLPVVTSYHTHYDEYLTHYGLGQLKVVGRAYLGWFHSQAALTLVPAEPIRRQLTAYGVPNVAVWSRGVDRQRFHPRFRDAGLRGSLGLGADDLLLLYVGRLAPEKNLSTLLEAFTRLHQQSGRPTPRLCLALVGGGPLTGSLKITGHPGIVLPGYQHGEALSRWYASADIFAFPSLTETFGNVVLEAQASGLPVVAFDCPALHERVSHRHDGPLVPPTEDMAEALRLLCQDPDYRQRLAAAARQKAEGQDWMPIFDALEQRYDEVVRTRYGRGLGPARPLFPRQGNKPGLLV